MHHNKVVNHPKIKDTITFENTVTDSLIVFAYHKSTDMKNHDQLNTALADPGKMSGSKMMK